jgi:hypothetical protein
MPPAPKLTRRWFQFGLQTMFVVVTLSAVFIAYNTHWMRQRHSYLADHPGATYNDSPTRAPGLLWLFGERGLEEVRVQVPGFNRDREFHKTNAGPEAEEARRLFPEARVVAKENNTIWYTWRPRTPWTWGTP